MTCMEPTPLSLFMAKAVECAFTTACEKGWHDGEHLPMRDRTAIAAKLALINSEVTEAYHAWLAADMQVTDDVLLELADVCIRSFDLLGAMSADPYARAPELAVHGITEDSFPTHLLDVHATVSATLEYLRKKEFQFPQDTESSIVGIALYVISLAHHLGHDLIPVIERKMAYNAMRTYRHGGKLL